MSVYETRLRLKSTEVDMYRRMRPSVLFRLTQEAAVAHTEALGMGRDKTLDRGILWMVTLQTAEIVRMPEYGERVVLRSWPGPTMHVLFPRYCVMETDAGEPLWKAAAFWTLVDARARRLVFPDSCGVSVDGVVTGEEIALPTPPRPLPCTESRSFTVPYSYTDLNGHMNNTRYLDLAEDCFPAAAAGRPLRAVCAEFTREAAPGETLDLRWGEEDGRYYLVGGKGRGRFRLSMTYG